MSITYHPYSYQQIATQWILDHDRCGLFLDMGLGKTVCTLTAISELMYDRLEINKVLVIAPLRVAQTVWAEEAQKWEHLKHLRVSKVLGTPMQREAGLRKKADIYVINREQTQWLVDNHKFDFDMVVVDELSSFKNNSAKRFRALRKVIRDVKRVVGLTGTPSPNGLMDLWPEIYLLDCGQRLGRTLSAFRQEYFTPGWGNGYVVYNYIPRKGSAETIEKKLSDICISMSKEKYLDMPDCVTQDIRVDLGKALVKYRTLEKQYLTEIQGEAITAVNAGALNTKLQQLANGAVYESDESTKDRKFLEVHDEKLKALDSLVEQANGQPVLVFVSYRSDISRIKKFFAEKHSELKVRELHTAEDITAWNNGQYDVAVAHPASIGHGLNLQQGGHIIVWYGLTWSLELYQQANDRLYRQGQKHTVSIYRLVANGTVDNACVAALAGKRKGQDALMEYLAARREDMKSA